MIADPRLSLCPFRSLRASHVPASPTSRVQQDARLDPSIAIVTIQAAVRGFHTRAFYHQRRTSTSIVVIQARWRGVVGRAAAAQKAVARRMTASATRVQAFVRGRSTANWFLRSLASQTALWVRRREGASPQLLACSEGRGSSNQSATRSDGTCSRVPRVETKRMKRSLSTRTSRTPAFRIPVRERVQQERRAAQMAGRRQVYGSGCAADVKHVTSWRVMTVVILQRYEQVNVK